jgi:hypothetical protein
VKDAAARRRDRIYYAIITVWAIGIVVGMALLWRYKLTPGKTGDAPARWPEDTTLVRAADAPTLLMFVRPDCPCTRASLGELAMLVSKRGGRLHAYVVMQRPARFRDRLEETEYWQRALSLPGVRVVADEHGAETRRFGAGTSGDVLLYDAAGTLIFHGGITGARGHSGDNAGRDRVAVLLQGGNVPSPESAVFGCDLDPTVEARK